MDSLQGVDIFATPRFSARALVSADAEALRILTDDRVITDAVDFLRFPFDLDQAKGLIAQQGAGDRFFGVRAADGRLVAVAGAHLREGDHIEIGYWVGCAFQGRGYATEIAQGLIAALLERFPKRRIMAECRPENAASWAVLRHCGLEPTGAAGQRPGRQILLYER